MGNGPFPEDPSRLLARARTGREEAGKDLLPILYRELHEAAHRLLKRQPPGQTLQTTALLHDAWMRLDQGSGASWESETHYLNLAARAMRQVLVDRARARRAKKRGGGRVGLDLTEDALQAWDGGDADVLDVHEALESLARHDEQLARIVELRFFGGLTVDEVARILELTPRQVSLAWSFARGWLKRELER